MNGQSGDADDLNVEDVTVGHENLNEDSFSEKDTCSSEEENKNLLHLLYRIAEDQSTRAGYVHRGINCNSCNQLPIRGIRFRCANCPDYDLCEQCEANEQHPKTHVFLKIKIPIPFLSSSRQNPLPIFYPGKPTQLGGSQRLTSNIVAQYARETGLTHSEVEALWDQFLCLASPPLVKSPVEDVLVINRKTFDKCFIPSSVTRSAATNLIYDRIFAFYNISQDGMISFSEFLSGLACLTKPSMADEKLRRIFNGYDFDQDGWADRKDFLRMFRAYYALNKELTKEIITDWGTESMIEQMLVGSQPISSVFPGNVSQNEPSRTGEGKTRDENGDYVIHDGGGILSELHNDAGDRHEVVANLFETKTSGNLGDAEHQGLEDSMLAEQIPEAESDFGREVIYQVTQEAFNELLDPLFKEREEHSLMALRTKCDRERAQTFHDQGFQSVSNNTDYHQKTIHTQGSGNISEPVPRIIPGAQNSELREQTLDLVLTEEAMQLRPDPTLPQNRPNSALIETDLRATPPSAHSTTSKTILASPGDPSGLSIPPLSEDRQVFLHFMNQIERHDNARGGPGRISFAEFKEIVTGQARTQMGFIGAWVDMAIF